MSMPRPRYAETIRLAMKTANNPFKRPLSVRELARIIGFSYEHLRKVTIGLPVVSEDFQFRDMRVARSGSRANVGLGGV